MEKYWFTSLEGVISYIFNNAFLAIRRNKMHKIIRLAKQYIESHDYDAKQDFRLAAVIVRGGNVVSVGYNKHATNSFVEHYTDLARGGDRNYALSTHAEMDAVLKGREKTDLRGCKIFVARLRNDTRDLGMSRPCEICQHVLYNYGIKRAFYSIDPNTYGIMKVDNPAKMYYKNDKIFNGSHDELSNYDLSFLM